MGKKRESDKPLLLARFIEDLEQTIQDHYDAIEDDLVHEGTIMRRLARDEARAAVVKDANSAAQQFIAYLKTQYPWELNHKKDDMFPTNWMKDDKTIAAIIESHKSFIPLVNYLHNRTRYHRGEKLKAMEEETIRRTQGKRSKYKGKHTYATFFTNKNFYDEVMQELHISKNSIQRYLAAFAKIGNIQMLFDGKTRGRLYADGYFTPAPNGSYRKHSFLKETKSLKAGLRRLNEFIAQYKKFEFND